jgi:hypothetical protein
MCRDAPEKETEQEDWNESHPGPPVDCRYFVAGGSQRRQQDARPDFVSPYDHFIVCSN